MFQNYEILEHRKIEDLNSDGYILKHRKTGAYVTLLLNDDENKVFYIGFRTPPTDSTGVAHILEHSVLCGSRKFPVKDPFIELAKGSLNTFLNAMTYPDKTVYPVASCNDKDFHNLVDVYLDAVFHPNIYREEKIFRQEGHHYELEDADGELTINGVVYNEMKGVYSSPDDVVEREIVSSLYPDITYGLESGGDPDDIPSLTYEEFLDFHGRYYHPSNSFLYLYGNLDAEEYLDFIDREYLSEYEALAVDSEVGFQKPFDAPRKITKEYPVLSGDEGEGTYLTYNISMGTSLDRELYVALDVLDYVLVSSPGALIRQALLDAKIGDDVYSTVEGGIYQPYFSITAKNAPEEREEEFVSIIEEKLGEAARSGLPEKALHAAINVFEFKYRESDFGSYPRGLMLGLQALDSWLYDRMSPFMHIEANATYRFLRENVTTGYFEGLLRKYFIDNTHKTVLKVVPKEGLTAVKEDALKEKLRAYKASLSPEEIQRIVEGTKELKEYQSRPDSPEDLEKIPMLSREDLKTEGYKLCNDISKIDDTLFVHHDLFTNGIGYLRLFFSLDRVPGDLIDYVGLFREVYGLVNTKDHTYNDLYNEININTGGMSFEYRTFPDYRDKKVYRSYFYIKTKVLYDKLSYGFTLPSEIIGASLYDDKKRLYEIISAARARMQSSMTGAGHQVASSRALSYLFPQYAADDRVSGYEHYRFLGDLMDHFEERADEVIAKLYEVARCVFRPENLTVDYTSDQKGLSGLPELVRGFREGLFTDAYEGEPYHPETLRRNEAFETAGMVQFVCRAGDYQKHGLSYDGGLRVLRTILGYDYLWNNVRVLGGAYGCMNAFGRTGAAYFVSYRDPNLGDTIRIFREASSYIASLTLDERQITQFIIGALSELDMPQTPQTKGAISFQSYLAGLTDEDFQKERDELLSVDQDKIRSLSRYIDAFLEDEILCVVGSKEKIGEAKELFDNIRTLL